jgi:hypothetical protein
VIYVIGEFREKDRVATAIHTLRTAGATAADIDVFSEEPVEFPRGVLDRPSRMSVISVLGAIGCGALATGFIYWAQHNYPIVTGGMPLFSLWATGVITYEMTMLGAIVATFGWFLWESGLVRRRDRTTPVPMVAPGSICLRVRCRGPHSAQEVDAMLRAGATGIERSES